MELLSAQGLSIAQGDRRLIEGLSMSIRAGELVALTGPSGMGKTTLLRTLAGLRDPAEGQVLLKGQPVEDMLRFRRGVIYVGQRPALWDETVQQNLERPFFFKVNKGGPSFEPASALALLTRLALPKDVLERSARALSVGEQQRVALVRALLLEPLMLLLDEPTSALDEASAAQVWTLLEERAQTGMAALAVTHGFERAHRTIALEPAA